MSVEELLQHVPPEAVYRRVPLPDDQNALGPWREAIASYVAPSEETQRVWDEMFDARGETVKAAEFPGVPKGDSLREFLRQNQRTSELVEGGVGRGHFQFPELVSEEQFDGDVEFLQGLRSAVRLLVLKANECQADGNFAAAARLLRTSLRLGGMVSNGDGYIVQYITGGLANRGLALWEIRCLATHEGLPRAAAEVLLAAIEEAQQAPEGLAQCLRVELYYWGLKRFDRLPADDLTRLCEALQPERTPPPPFSDEYSEAERVERSAKGLAESRRQIRFLLEGRPAPFDKIATAKTLGKEVACMIRNLDLPQPSRWFDVVNQARRMREYIHRRRLRRQRRVWPLHLLGGTDFFAMYRTDSEAEAALAEMEREGGPDAVAFFRPLTEAQLAAARKRIQRCANPVGQFLLAQMHPTDCRSFRADWRAALEKARATLAERLKQK